MKVGSMTSKIIPHIFGSLMALNKSLALLEREKFTSPTTDLRDIMIEMNKVAHLIQLQFAKGDSKSATRSLQVFYGLLSMIRPIIMDGLKEAAGVRTGSKVQNLH